MFFDELKLCVVKWVDVFILFDLIKVLVEYENLFYVVIGNVVFLEVYLFGEFDSDRFNYCFMVEVIIVELIGKFVGFFLFFYNYLIFLI